MGLDMYLKAERYVGGWEHDRSPIYDTLVKAVGVAPDSSSPSFTVKATVGYWRKANAIHKWFVDNVQDGRDECQESDVSREQLEELRSACKQVLDSVETVAGSINEGTTHHGDGKIETHTRPGQVIAQQGIAASVLPTQGGFFFGGTDYDEYYLDDLRETVEIIDRALSLPAKEWDFTYRASW